ncbi:hypothetical protein [Amycolatopsis nigrescens]|uniref:hypothetical protein n=1 Tax=Amycolatopsis nigrescens TaxID=381445 RepID=UPI00037A3B0B|nr:hypothetical protein [Amycolatopsis nigrescens]
MAAVLTEASVVKCVHGGAVKVTATGTSLTVHGQAVLLPSDLLIGVIDCPNASAPCATITGITKGLSAKLRLGGQPVLLATAEGTTNSGTWRVADANQAKLEAL